MNEYYKLRNDIEELNGNITELRKELKPILEFLKKMKNNE